ncbi:sigma 54-interacting transcriptional regulator [Rhodohalobacter halophilus]|uniref:sigma 54-interacting transcriptional regulator n=1 Tax=Rhodohalobacter halophilus TaxID=1812810 RepID=UPI00083F55A6|nr:sigma 54-interacting transcriptional regulator [Rhodohalobacter halophilus]
MKTLGELKESGYQSISVKDELRKNMIRKMKSNEPLFPGILGYEKTVLPQLQNAILARHDLILLGLRGQAKTRILRLLVDFLDDKIPVIEGSEVNDDPLNPISKYGKKMVEKHGDDTPIAWLEREERYGEKLATPDTTVADLIGDLDPIKAASKKLTLADEEVINFGLIPRTNRGIFVINELPDLQPRIQVALLNIMQERDIQIRGFNVRIPLDVSLAFSANPEDYTNRGNIITPLKDRIDSQIITHYPKDLKVASEITKQEAWSRRNGEVEVEIPDLYRNVLEYVAFEARESEYIDQKSGVSTRMTITSMEQAVSAAERRAIRNGEAKATLRVTDLFYTVPALTGKLELVYEGEQEGAVNVAKHLLGKAIRRAFLDHFDDPSKKQEGENENGIKPILDWFASGNSLDIPDLMKEKEYRKALESVDGLKNLVKGTKSLAGDDLYSAMDLVIESLHQFSKLGKDELDAERSYSDMLGSMLGGMSDFDEDDFEL